MRVRVYVRMRVGMRKLKATLARLNVKTPVYDHGCVSHGGSNGGDKIHTPHGNK